MGDGMAAKVVSITPKKSDRREKPQGGRKVVVTAPVERERGGEATTVEQRAWQLGLHFETAENPQGADGGAASHRRDAATRAAPKSKGKERTATSATMEEVARRLALAFQNVASNRGAPGPDRQSIDAVREQLDEILLALAAALVSGTYEPGPIRRVWIPKPGGGQRGLGIPHGVDRVVAEAVRQVLEPLYEPTFHASSHGFRPERSCHTAIAEARQHLEEGYEWVVDLDVEKFLGRGREPPGRGGHNPRSRRAGCEQHLSGSVRGALGNPVMSRGLGAPTRCEALRVTSVSYRGKPGFLL
jgi:RNA-directed DNA polymerase